MTPLLRIYSGSFPRSFVSGPEEDSVVNASANARENRHGKSPDRSAGLALVLFILSVFVLPSPGGAWTDLNNNKIDDAIDQVNTQGWAAAFENGDPQQRMAIGVEAGQAIRYAVYIRYDHKPTAADQAALATTGVSMN